MEKIWAWVIVISLYLIITFLFWRLTNGHFKKEYGEKMFKLWGTKTFYWQGILLISGGLTVVIIFLLKWANIFNF